MGKEKIVRWILHLKKAVEEAMARSLPVIISLIARLAGLGGIGATVQKLIKTAGKPVNKVINALVDRSVKFAKKIFKKKGKKKKKNKDKKGKIDKTLGKELKFSVGVEKHRLWIDNKGGKIKVNVASKDPGPIEKRLKKWEEQLSTLGKDNKAKAIAAISKSKPLVNKTMSEAKEEAIITKAILKDKRVSSAEVKTERKAEKETIAEEKKLEIYLMKLFNIFGYGPEDFLAVYNTTAKDILDILIKGNKELWTSYKYDGDPKEIEKKKKFINYKSSQKTKDILKSYEKSQDIKKLKEDLEKYLENKLENKKGVSEHTKYNPKVKSVKIDGNEFTITYEYVVDNKKKVFVSVFNFGTVNDDKGSTKTQKTVGTNLKLKEKSTRGKTDSSGQLRNTTALYKQYWKDKREKDKNIKKGKIDPVDESVLVAHFRSKSRKSGNIPAGIETYSDKINLLDSAHHIADWFTGSGYKKSLNLTVTSAEYNRITMGGAEKNIAKRLTEESVFNLTVTSTWDSLTDKEVTRDIHPASILKEIKGNTKMKDITDQSVFAKAAADELHNILSGEQDPRRILNVKYEPKITYPKGSTKKSDEQNIGCDVWMSSYFKFNNKIECKYKSA